MTAAAKAAPVIDILVESTLWKDAPGATPGLRRAVAAAAAALSTKRAELAIVLTDDSAIRLLNRDWRGIDAATNVLSFPASSPAPHRRERGAPRGQKSIAPMRKGRAHQRGSYDAAPRLLGDIVLAYETIAREAREEHKPFVDHLAHLAVHGFLHLLGYDHERDDDAERMEKIERKILAQLAIPDPYPSAARAES
jgi:probable rRNA maturation factor